MNDRKPKFSYHKHKRVYFVKYNGHFHWLGKDERPAKALYNEHVIEWAKWRAERDRELSVKVTIPRGLTMASLFEQFMRASEPNWRDKTIGFYQASLRRFLGFYGRTPAAAFNAKLLNKWRSDLLEIDQNFGKLGKDGKPLEPALLSRKTINHELAAIKTMLQWGFNVGLCPEINLRGIRLLNLSPPPKKGYTIHQMRSLFCSVPTHVKPWVAVNWLTMARPTEVVRACNKQGKWEEPGVYELFESKTSQRSRMPRRLVFSDLALMWLDRCEAWTSREDSYYQAIYRADWVAGPHPLRHGAATHLHGLGGLRADIDLILGHMPPRVSVTYLPIAWQPLRALASRITL